MRVEIWSDIICPWCGLGIHQLDAALARFAHTGDVQLVHRSFQLDERAPADRTESVRQMLREKKGLSDAQIDGITARIESLAEAQGLRPYVVRDNHVGNTALAHEFAVWATELGRSKEAWDALYKAYFAEARSIFDVESLVTLASELGLKPDAAREVLSSRRYAPQVKADGHEARRLGVTGVPFILIDGRYAVSGAQPVDAMLRALELAWSERPASAVEASEARFAEGTACSPDACDPTDSAQQRLDSFRQTAGGDP